MGQGGLKRVAHVGLGQFFTLCENAKQFSAEKLRAQQNSLVYSTMSREEDHSDLGEEPLLTVSGVRDIIRQEFRSLLPSALAGPSPSGTMDPPAATSVTPAPSTTGERAWCTLIPNTGERTLLFEPSGGP